MGKYGKTIQEDGITKKWCFKCKQYKDISIFQKCNKVQSGMTGPCRDCRTKYTRKYRRNSAAVRANDIFLHKKWSTKFRIEVLSHYCDGQKPYCKCCGEDLLECLAIDHINGDGAQHRRAGIKSSKLYTWLKKNNYPAGFQVLCHSCNRAKSNNKKCCPHQTRYESGVQTIWGWVDFEEGSVRYPQP